METTAPLDTNLFYSMVFIGSIVGLLIFYTIIRAAVASGNKKSVAHLERIAYILTAQAKTQGITSEELKVHIRQEKLEALEKQRETLGQVTYNERRNEIMAE